MKKLTFSLIAAVAVLALGAVRASATYIGIGEIDTNETHNADRWSNATGSAAGTTVTLHPGAASTVFGSGSLIAANDLAFTEPASLPLTTGAVTDDFYFDHGAIEFVLTDITSVSVNATFLDISGTGYWEEAGYTNTSGTFAYSGNDTSGHYGHTQSSASETFDVTPPPPTPEPSSLVLLGTGLLGAAFLLFRRNRAAHGGSIV